jgi:hypothetical protein
VLHRKYNMGSKSEDPKCCKPRIKDKIFETHAFQIQKQLPKLRKHSSPKTMFSEFFEYWHPRKPDLLVFLQFFYKETRYWVALNVYQKNIIGVHYAILISMGLWLQNQQNIE